MMDIAYKSVDVRLPPESRLDIDRALRRAVRVAPACVCGRYRAQVFAEGETSARFSVRSECVCGKVSFRIVPMDIRDIASAPVEA